MKLYNYYRSSASYRVRIALNLKNLPYNSILINLGSEDGEQQKQEYLDINPEGLIPALINQGKIYTQSLAIIEYLNEIHPNPPLLPDSIEDRAFVRSLCYAIACDIHPLNNLRVLKKLKSQFKASNNEVNNWIANWIKIGFTGIEAQLKRLNKEALFSFGNKVSMADLCLIPQVYNALRFKVDLTPYPIIVKIYEKCLKLEAFQKASPENDKVS